MNKPQTLTSNATLSPNTDGRWLLLRSVSQDIRSTCVQLDQSLLANKSVTTTADFGEDSTTAISSPELPSEQSA